MIFLNAGDSWCAFYELVKSSLDFRDDLVLLDILFPEYLVKVFDKLHSDKLMGELVVVLVDESWEPEV